MKKTKLSETTRFWVILGVFCLFIVLFSVGILQNYLYMRPCPNCVYIRLAFIVIMIGAFLGAIKPKKTKIIGYIVTLLGLGYGYKYALILDKIHRALHSDDVFGVAGCETEAKFPFGIELDKFFPDAFKSTGDCGMDYPVVPENAVLSEFQQKLIALYQDGWYLLPKYEFLNMAQSVILLLILIGMWLFFGLFKKVYVSTKPKIQEF